MQPADYRLVRSNITSGIMMAIKRSVMPPTMDRYFSRWLYGERKSTRIIPAVLPRPMPCLVCCRQTENNVDVSLLTVDDHLFVQCLPLFNRDQLMILNSLIDDDRQSYHAAIRQQYGAYRRTLMRQLREKRAGEYYLV